MWWIYIPLLVSIIALLIYFVYFTTRIDKYTYSINTQKLEVSEPLDVEVLSGNLNVGSITNPVEITSGSGLSVNISDPVEISNTGLSVFVTNPVEISGNVGTSITNKVDVEVIRSAGQVDAFGRERVSLPFTLGDYTHIYGINPDFFDITTGGGSFQYIENKASVKLVVEDGTSGSAIHQTKRYHHYMPGKSQLILSTFVFGTSQADTIKRTGYFDDKNGIYFEQAADGQLSFNIRSYTTGAVSVRQVSQNNWDSDKADGSGQSGFNLDITKTQLFFIDFQWLGVGKVRCGFVNKNDYILCHTFYNSNNLDTVFMSSGNLPVRCEINRDTATAGSSSFDQICSTVISEGGYVESGRDWSVGTSITKAIPNDNETDILAIKLKDSFGTYNYDNRMTIRLGEINVLSTGESIIYNIKKVNHGSSLNASNWTDINEESGVQFATSFSIPSDNIFSLENGYASGGSQGNKNFANSGGNNPPVSAKQNYIVQNFNSDDSEAYILTAKRLNGNTANVTASMKWREIY